MLTSMANISVQPNIVDPDQTAPSGAVRYGSTLIVTKTSFNNELEDNIWVLRKGNATYAYVNGLLLCTDKHCGPGLDCSEENILIWVHIVCYKDGFGIS